MNARIQLETKNDLITIHDMCLRETNKETADDLMKIIKMNVKIPNEDSTHTNEIESLQARISLVKKEIIQRKVSLLMQTPQINALPGVPEVSKQTNTKQIPLPPRVNSDKIEILLEKFTPLMEKLKRLHSASSLLSSSTAFSEEF